MEGNRIRADLYVDPVCPFASLAARWLAEVGARRPLDLRLHLMSLWLLNEGRSVDPAYRDLLAASCGPSRVACAAVAQRGEAVLLPLCAALAQRIFDGASSAAALAGRLQDPGRWRRHLGQATAAALADAGLPADLGAAAESAALDEDLRASHQRGVTPLGDRAGTPVLHLEGAAVFGPVLSRVPRGAEAVRIFDGLRGLTGGGAVQAVTLAPVPALDFA